MTGASIAARLDRLPTAAHGRSSRALWAAVLGATGAGAGAWLADLATGSLAAGIAALWCFIVVAVALALVLPLPYALVSPLFAGLLGWLVDMLPLVILAGWTATVLRWAYGLARERRLPRGGRWIWLPLFLAAWTGLAAPIVAAVDFKRFLLLLGMQGIMSGIILAVADAVTAPEDRVRLAAGLAAFVVVCTAGVVLEYAGVPVNDLQEPEVSERIEAAYGLDAFPNNLGMIKYGLSSKAGARELRDEIAALGRSVPLPPHEVFLPRFRAFDNHIVVRFAGSARPYAGELAARGVELVYDNVGLAPANTVPRWRSFARNSLTYAGICVVVLPLALFLSWSAERRRRLLGRIAAASCLAGAGFSLARGSWIAILIGVGYLVVDGMVSRRRKLGVVAMYVAAAAAVTGLYVVRYGVDPLNARALGKGSINTRASLYEDTVESMNGIHVLVGFGTERPRTEEGVSHVSNRYIPRSGTHSTYLNYLFRAGAPAAAAIALLYAAAGLHARAAARLRTGGQRVFATVVAASVVSVAAHAMILSLFVEPIYTLTVSLVLGLATAAGTGLPGSVLPWKTRTAA